VALSIAIFADQFPELSETFVSGEARELQRQGHDVVVIAERRAATPDPGAAQGLVVHTLGGVSWGALAWLVARHPLRCLADVVARRRWRREEPVSPLRRLAWAARKSADRDHLHAHFAKGAALDAMRVGALLGIPYSVMTHGYDVFLSPSNLEEKHARAAFAVTACAYSAAWLREHHAVEAQRLIVGVDGEAFRRAAPPPGGRSVIAVARLVEKKGLAHLVEAARILRERGRPLDRVTIVGDGPLRDALAAAAGPEVELVGTRAPAEVRELLERADLLAMPCVVAADGDRDTMPVVVKEALAMEIPVVASDEVGLPEVVQDGWGRLVPPGDAAALADAIDDLLSLPPESRAAMGRAGRAFVLRECSLQGETERLAGLIGGKPRS
jgi:colanic acid/amylovoran biosynthesis glycosyltransferase